MVPMVLGQAQTFLCPLAFYHYLQFLAIIPLVILILLSAARLHCEI
jgi:hypothetical protein